jgi:hypothetical protein
MGNWRVVLVVLTAAGCRSTEPPAVQEQPATQKPPASQPQPASQEPLTTSCRQDSDCVPDPRFGEPKICVAGSPRVGVPKPDAMTPFDEGCTCGCQAGTCALKAGPAMQKEIEQAVRGYVSAHHAACSSAHVTVEIESLTAAGARITSSALECGHRCTLELKADRRFHGWSVAREHDCSPPAK